MPITRRWFVRTAPLAALALAGCSSSRETGVTDLSLTNHTSSEVTVTVRVVRKDDTRVLADTVSIAVGATRTYENPVDGSTVRVSVDVENGPEGTREWTEWASDSSGLFVDIRERDVSFSVVAA
ncbi:hypothetical protein [Salarchaeum japonicum]|uniref:Uncharacterized protein n=1 Tax=Salarchaeum japonicum TaxID=555573 RepID=A0AAV3SYY0_9EURY|nr:hypothetical protein [Salarchaeum japonicum]